MELQFDYKLFLFDLRCIITQNNNACQVVTGIMLSNQCIVSVLLDVFRLDTNSPLSLSTSHQHKHPLSSYLKNEGKRGRGGASNKQANNSQIFPKRERERETVDQKGVRSEDNKRAQTCVHASSPSTIRCGSLFTYGSHVFVCLFCVSMNFLSVCPLTPML